MDPLLHIKNLTVSIEDKNILKDVSLEIEPGKIYALMGPNGSGKSTLSKTVMGHPKYKVESGQIFAGGEDITAAGPDDRAKQGLFLSFQYPKTIPGVSLSNFLRSAYKSVKSEEIRVFDFKKKLKDKMETLSIPEYFADRHVNEGFSGGEKKKAEILQAMILDPKVIIMDETDSGLDVDALKIVAEGVKKLQTPDKAIILITHYFKILEYLTPDVVFVLKDGELVETGGSELAKEIEQNGFQKFGVTEVVEQPATEVVEKNEEEKSEPEEPSSPFAMID
ncbi:MAG: Fe-S cluster assembly ATPase SufC [Candidatus Gracilibacteria bacterium]|nr:Fe-S cluster assembly ATPase SufC [Candidatus Gracilibacteria bacterium]